MPVLRRHLLLGGQKLFLYGGNHDVVRIDHFGEMDFADFRKQLIGIEFREAIVGVNPTYQFGGRDPHRIIDGTIDAAAMISLSFSKRGQPVCLPFTRSNCSRAFMGTSMALPAISPSPMAACPSPK